MPEGAELRSFRENPLTMTHYPWCPPVMTPRTITSWPSRVEFNIWHTLNGSLRAIIGSIPTMNAKRNALIDH